MTDHRVTDLSYGHFGEVTYDVDTKEWRFSVEPSGQQISVLLPLTASIPPSIFTFPSTITAAERRTTSIKFLLKSHPETYPAKPLILSNIHSQATPHPSHHIGNLLAIAQATDLIKTFGSPKTKIIATACGEAGHVLRLIKPRVERHEWGRQSSIRLSAIDAASSDQGYWVGTGGRILQITCAEGDNGSSTRLAVRQAGATTIFRPLYEANLTPATTPNGYAKMYPASRINANPIAVLTAAKSGSRTHADVSWNPWYSRQFAVVDDFGSWSIWDIEGGVKKNNSARLIAGKRGNIYDGFVTNSAFKLPDNADGWYQILWVGAVSTIVVCNRRHLAIFDVKSTPTRVHNKDFLSPRNSDWILDLKRSPINPTQLFVLTSSRVFWLEIIPAGEEKDGEVGFRIMLSYRHFRNTNDFSMKLAILRGKDVSIAIFSEETDLLNVYTFWSVTTGLDTTASQTFLTLESNSNKEHGAGCKQLQSLCFLATSLTPIPNRPLGLEHTFISEAVHFYQLLAVSSDLGLSSGICTVHPLDSNLLHLPSPTRSYSYKPGYMSSKHVANEPWIIPDGQADEFGNHSIYLTRGKKQPAPLIKTKDDSRFTLNFRFIFEQAFNINGSGTAVKGLTELLESTLGRLKQAKEKDSLPMTTFLELSPISEFAEDLEQGSPILRDFLESLEKYEEPDASSALILSNLMRYPGFGFQALEISWLPKLSEVYDQVAENWIASLPLPITGMTRLAKFKLARRLAVEVCLSAIGASLRNKASDVPSFSIPERRELTDPSQKSALTSREGSPALYSSQLPLTSLPESSFGLPTPERTPSLYSHSTVSGTESSEDAAISRLRQYAVSIKSNPDLGASKILSHWPITPGVDPATYSYETARKTIADDGGGDRDFRKKGEQARRKQRIEKFLSKQNTAPAEALSQSQPRFTPFGSQPNIAHTDFSSETFPEVPMTQPDRGAFGSRSTQSKTKSKKKKTAGFR